MNEEVQITRQASIPGSTTKDANWCVNVWKDWSEHRNNFSTKQHHSPEDPAQIVPQLSYWLERYVLQIRAKNGDGYNPNSLHHLVWHFKDCESQYRFFSRIQILPILE